MAKSYNVTARAKYSRTYRGRCDKGTFSESEWDKGVVRKRVEALQDEGYEDIQIIETIESDYDEA